ncbi:MAG: response regulator [Candidatus Acidiferrales bacterium]
MSAAKRKARILMVDDHEILREGVRSLLAKVRPEWQISGEATDGDQAISLTQSLRPDIVILDISMPRVSGLEACHRMREMGLRIPVLIFTTHESETIDAEVRRAGAQGYVLKSQAARNLVHAIGAILGGGTFFGEPSAPRKSPSAKPRSDPGMVHRKRLARAN